MTTQVPASMTAEGVTAAAVAAKADASSVTALSASVTALQGLQLTSGTAQATTSGTSVDFTGIPATAKRVTIVLAGVSLNATSGPLIQLGSGSIVSTGYFGIGTRTLAATAITTSTSGVPIYGPFAAANTLWATIVCTLVSANTWVISVVGADNTNATVTSAGGIALGGALDRVRITTISGTDTFDAGSANILWE